MSRARKSVRIPNPNTYRCNGLAIIGPHGNVWGPHLFDTKEAALEYLTNWWRGIKDFNPNRWKVCKARQTTTRLRNEKPERLTKRR